MKYAENPHTEMGNRPFRDLADSYFRIAADNKHKAFEAGCKAERAKIVAMLRARAGRTKTRYAFDALIEATEELEELANELKEEG